MAMNFLKDVAEYLTPVLTTTQFHEKGVLTPEEFVAAGDHLVYTCKTWTWASGNPAYAKKYLPADKQYLITRNVPSMRRAHTYGLADAKEELVEGASGDDGWLSTHADGENKMDDEELSTHISTLTTNPTSTSQPTTSSDDAIPDMDDFADDNLVEDDDSATLKDNTQSMGTSTYLTATEPSDNIVRTRTYDLSITYDKYYRTPRVYLFGYDERRQPLTPNQIMEDISSDHANKTVTVENHPHQPVQHLSIHPCKHASVMKKMIDMAVEKEAKSKASSSTSASTPTSSATSSSSSSASSSSSSSTSSASSSTTPAPAPPAIEPAQYMFIFLKFISSVIPTIEYDFTL